MAVQEAEDVYASLLLTDTYLPGALVLAHSLRDAGTTKKLAILVTLDTVSVEVVEQLKTVYDYVIPVDRIQTEHPANLGLMGRPDLHSAFTKINLWRQTQFRKIVYVDADIVAYRAPDELFDLPHAFSAAPDIGWPDLFNTGVMVLAPNMGDYHAMTAMAQKGISFDGADQGLLNMYFKNSFNRLSFTYNVTPSAHYQYVPAYKHFQSSINMVHFIGPEKPWVQGRGRATGSSPFDNMVGRWWAVYDRHYGETQEVPEIVRYFVKGEFQPTIRQSPPADSRPEAINFPQTHYAMSSDPTPFVPPERYPSPPKDMWYEVPKQAPEKPKPLFPWEANQPRPTRVFGHPAQPERTAQPSSQAQPKPDAAATQPGRPHTPPSSGPTTRTAPSPAATTDTWSSFSLTNAWDNVPEINRYVDRRMQQHRRSRSGKDLAALGGSEGGSPGGPGDGGVSDLATPRRGSKVTDFPSEADRPSLPVTPAPIRRPGGDGGGGDDGKEQLLQGAEGVPGQDDWANLVRLYKDPATQLQKLAKEQSELAFRRLGAGDNGEGGKEAIPSRPLPFGSEGAKSPTYVAPAPPVVSPKPVKPATGTSQVNRILAAAPKIR
ncbi:glycogenin [Chaetomium sp. MPI-CAGE-AT-0009]|nr:glycogenin [Chaetomium sp. MPI-CAGE-AT-0009]